MQPAATSRSAAARNTVSLCYDSTIRSCAVALIVTVLIDAERPLDRVNGAVTRSYIGLAEYPVSQRVELRCTSTYVLQSS